MGGRSAKGSTTRPLLSEYPASVFQAGTGVVGVFDFFGFFEGL
jgi:hypothetical protein